MKRVRHGAEDRADRRELGVARVEEVGVEEGLEGLVELGPRHRRAHERQRLERAAGPRWQLDLDRARHLGSARAAQAELQRLGHAEELRQDALLLLAPGEVERLELVLLQELRQQHALDDRGVDVVAAELLVARDREVREVEALRQRVGVDAQDRDVAGAAAEVEDEDVPGPA